MPEPPRGILFLCVANSARSQLAEALARRAAPAGVRVWSAGSVPTVINPFTVKILEEIGVDPAAHHAKGLAAIPLEEVDTVITLCAEEVCPVLPGAVRRFHWPLPDPAAVTGDEEARLAAFRATRDAIAQRIPELFSQPPSR